MSNLNGYPLLFPSKYTIPTSNLIAHYDASVSSSVHISTGVSQWDDLSGNSNHLLQATSASQPTYTGSGTSSLINFDGSNDNMKASFTLSSQSIYLVMKTNVNTVNGVIFDGFSGNNRQMQQNTYPSIFINGLSGTVSGLTTTPMKVICVVMNAATASISVNDGPKQGFGGGSPGGTDPNGLCVGSRGNGSFFSNISVAEIYNFNILHSAAIQTPIINSLRSKWGI